MTSPRRRRTVATVIAAASALVVLSGCANGFDAATYVEGSATEGSILTTSTVEAHNVLLVAAPGAAEPTVIGTLVNESGEADTLVRATVGDPAVDVAISGAEDGRITVPNRSLVVITDDQGPQLTVPGLEATPGSWEPVTFFFERGGEATGQVLVQTSAVVAQGTAPALQGGTVEPTVGAGE